MLLLPATCCVASHLGGMNGQIKARSDDAYRALIAKIIDSYQSDLFNPHWADLVKLQLRNTPQVNMTSLAQAAGVASRLREQRLAVELVNLVYDFRVGPRDRLQSWLRHYLRRVVVCVMEHGRLNQLNGRHVVIAVTHVAGRERIHHIVNSYAEGFVGADDDFGHFVAAVHEPAAGI